MGPVKPIHFRPFIGIPCHSTSNWPTIGSGPTIATKPRRRNDDFSLNIHLDLLEGKSYLEDHPMVNKSPKWGYSPSKWPFHGL